MDSRSSLELGHEGFDLGYPLHFVDPGLHAVEAGVYVLPIANPYEVRSASIFTNRLDVVLADIG